MMTEKKKGEHSADILVVDDTPPNLKLLCGILTSIGYQVRSTVDGETTLRIVRDDPPDLILLDIQLPDIDGYEVCQQLKEDEKTRDIPIIFISAMSDTDEIVKGFTVGGVDYITKPIKIKEVLARVANHLTLLRQRKQIEAMREQERQHFESLARMKNEFISMATHDLKNPLNIILGYSVLLSENNAITQDAFLQQAITLIQQNVHKMRSLVTDMLDLAQIETGVDLSVKPVSLTAFLRECLESFNLSAEQKQITLTFSPSEEDVTFPLDADRMARVIDNLISNAIKYTPEGGLVDLAVQVNTDNVIIQVSDTGLGIPEEDIPHLFKTFYRVSDPQHRAIGGTGLGLSIVKAVVEQHGGQVSVESAPGKGSTFSIQLPLMRDDVKKLDV
jgi:two-component system sensor histidine kinase/response regulator